MGDEGGHRERKRQGDADVSILPEASPTGGESDVTQHKRPRHLGVPGSSPKWEALPSAEAKVETSSQCPDSPLANFTTLSLLPSGRAADVSSPKGRGCSMAGKGHSGKVCRPLDSERVGREGRIRKVEFIRLLEEALQALGFEATAAELERESGVALESGQVGELRCAVLAGDWDLSRGILRGLADVSPAALRQAEFLLQEQKFLELLEAGDTSAALLQLRTQAALLCGDRRRLHHVASWLMCTSREDLLGRAGWEGRGRNSRVKLMEGIEALLPPSLMIPHRRLETLVEQTVRRQEEECTYHNDPQDSISLFFDHDCGRDQIPSVTTQILEEHTDEVWHVQFSHDGTRLASASKDSKAVIWEIQDEFSSTVLHVLQGHSQALSFVAWSPDDTKLVTCSSDHLVKLWDTHSGLCLHTYRKHSDPVTSCAWFPCGRRFLSVAPFKSGSEAQRSLYCWDVDGHEVASWLALDGMWPQHLLKGRINDVAISHDGKLMVTICSEQKIVVHHLETGEFHILTEPRSVTSLSMSHDSRFALVNVSTGCIHLWDLQALDQQQQWQAASEYKGQVQGRFVIRSCFGGSHQSFIVSGSEDSQVYIWHRPSSEILHVLPGHSGTINAVSWPTSRPLMFASASDDRTVRIWGLRSARQQASSQTQWGATCGNGLAQ